MSVQNVSSLGGVSFKSLAQQTKETQKETIPEVIDGKKKLALALTALAVTGAVTTGIICHKRNHKAEAQLGRQVSDIVRTTQNSVDDMGNAVSKTFKNGKLFSTRTTFLNADGSKRIQVDYADKTPRKIIDITADGVRKVM